MDQVRERLSETLETATADLERMIIKYASDRDVPRDIAAIALFDVACTLMLSHLLVVHRHHDDLVLFRDWSYFNDRAIGSLHNSFATVNKIIQNS